MTDTVTIVSNCPVCKGETKVQMERSQLLAWRNGVKVQRLFPEWTSIERETLMSGVCSDKCWDELWRQ